MSIIILSCLSLAVTEGGSCTNSEKNYKDDKLGKIFNPSEAEHGKEK